MLHTAVDLVLTKLSRRRGLPLAVHLLLSLLACGSLVLLATPLPAPAQSTLPPAGTYQIAHQDSGLCLDSPAYSKTSGVRLQGYTCKHTSYMGNQQFVLEAVTGGYRLRGVDSQLCADLPSSSTADGTSVQQWSCHGGQNQIWHLQAESYGYVQITSHLDTTKCLYIDTTSTAHGIRLSRCSTLPTRARSFAFVRTKTHYAIKLAPTGQCLDMPGYTTAAGATPQLFPCKTDPADVMNQEWTLEPGADGTVRLRQRYSGKCLDLRGGSFANGTILEQNTCTTSNNQRWRLLAENNERWKLQNVASGACADFYNAALRQWPCSATYATQLYAFTPGLSGGSTVMTSGAQLPVARTGPAASYAVDSTLVHPTITASNVVDNTITLEWSDPNGNATQRYFVFTWESIPGNPASTGHDEFTNLPIGRRAIWIGTINGRALIPGRTYTIDVLAVSAAGVSPFHTAARFEVALPGPSVRIGNPTTGAVSTPTVLSGFAVWDVNNDGIVNGAPGAGGAFPRFASSSGTNTIAATGNLYASANGQRANVIVGYFLQEGGSTTFIANHLFIDPMTNAGTSIAVLYGDTSGALGSRVWVSPPSAPGSLVVWNGNPALGLPNIVEGSVTAPTLASDGSPRIVEFDFSLALEER